MGALPPLQLTSRRRRLRGRRLRGWWGAGGRSHRAGQRREAARSAGGVLAPCPPRRSRTRPWRLACPAAGARRHPEERLQQGRASAGARRHPEERLQQGRGAAGGAGPPGAHPRESSGSAGSRSGSSSANVRIRPGPVAAVSNRTDTRPWPEPCTQPCPNSGCRTSAPVSKRRCPACRHAPIAGSSPAARPSAVPSSAGPVPSSPGSDSSVVTVVPTPTMSGRSSSSSCPDRSTGTNSCSNSASW